MPHYVILRLNPSKCEWMSKELEYFGYRVDCNGIHPTAAKVRAIVEAPQPADFNQLKAYLGLLMYFSKFMDSPATVAAALYRLVKAGQRWSWGQAESAAFARTKQLLVQAKRWRGPDQDSPGADVLLNLDSSMTELFNFSPGPGELPDRRSELSAGAADTPGGEPVSPPPDAAPEAADVGPFHGLPSLVQKLLEKQRGITALYAWQEECLGLPAVRERRNLVYSLPTSGGKTLVAELLIMRELLCRRRDCMLVLPYVALVQEKVRALAPFGIALGFLLEEYAGARGAFPPARRRKRRVLYVCTIEKASGLVTSLLEQSRAEELGLAVIDEVHMLGEPGGRGATLELLVTKLKVAAPQTHLVSMSATIGNMPDLAAFLEADVYSRPFRPVQLREHVLLDGQLLEVTGSTTDSWEQLLTPRRRLAFQYSPEQRKRDPDGVGGLVAEVVPANSCLVFCPTRKNCEAVALMICGALGRELGEHQLDRKKALLAALVNEGSGSVCPTLRQTLRYGVAYHHSGLTTDERKLLEEAYLEGTLCCLCCTSTLAAGVNLPAKRVVLRSPYTGSAFLSRGRYKQMVGRAGRAGIDDSGESILIVAAKDSKLVGELLMSPLERCVSTLLERDGHGLRRLLLSAVTLGLADSPAALVQVASRSLLAAQADALQVDLPAVVRLLRVSRRDGAAGPLPDGDRWAPELQLKVSRLGTAAVKGNVDLRVAGRLYDDLVHAQSALAVINQLHLLYLVTPYDMMDNIRPAASVYFDLYMSLEPEEVAVARLIGVTEAHVVRMMSGGGGKATDRTVAHRFYLTLALHDTLRAGSLWTAADRLQLHRGQLQALLQATAAFSAAVLHFCQQLDEFWPFVQLLDVFNRKLATGCAAELAQLMELPAVKQGRARALFAAGYKSLSDVANADPEALVRTLDHLPRRVARQMVDSAKMLVLEKAEALQEEAEFMLDGLKSAQFYSSPGLTEVLLNSSRVESGPEEPTNDPSSPAPTAGVPP
ncbi:helicase POLQ-like [Pollicipes pollicipes]|uniref:helicase POLQ-like n=1 Tax=Pollicipes pollicipes TaxID=41117 RepID=UPI001884AF5C|nr:helicase POLQ-like [Pollicipes pollicipes]